MFQAGAFIADDWSAGERLDVLGGLRWNMSRTRLPASDGFAATTVSDDGFAGNLSVAYGVTESVRLVANLGQGFRAPNVFDLGTFGDRPGNRFNVPNPHLEPEHVTTFDAGWKVRSDRFAGELIGYYSRYRDKITSVLTGDVTDSGRLVVQSRNAASLVLYGAEFAVQHGISDTVEWRAQLTWTHGEETFAGDDVPGRPHSAAQWQRRHHVASGNPLDAGWLAELRRPAGSLQPARRRSTRGFDRAARRAGRPGTSARPGKQAQHVFTSLQYGNLGDRRYREFGSGLDAAGRGFVLTLELRL